MKKVNIILANAPVNNGNRGCLALTYTSIWLIDMIMSEKCANYCLYLSDSYFNDNNLHVISISNKKIAFQSIGYPIGLTWKEYIKIYLNPKVLLSLVKIFKRVDYVLDIGQGDSFADIYGEIRFRKIDRIHKCARFFRKKYLLLPQTIGPFCNERIRRKAIKSIENAAVVMTRDEQSYDYVNEIAPKQRHVAQYIDVAFMLPYKKEVFDDRYIHVGLNISALLWHGGYTRNNQFGLKDDYPSLVRAVIKHFLSDEAVMLHLIPHVVEAERGVENDYAVSYDILQENIHPRLVLAPFFLGPCEAKGYISGLDFFMGARMHATIAAFSSGVPVVPMAYSRKFNGLFEDTLDYKYMVDLKQDPNEKALKTIISAYNQRAKLKELIQSRLDGTVEEKKQLLRRDLTKFLQL